MKKSVYMGVRQQLRFKPSHGEILKYLCFDITVVALIVGVWNWYPQAWIAIALSPLTSILMFRNFALMHDATHGAVSDDPLVNNIIGNWCGIWAGLPFQSWKQSHLLHHYWSGNLEKDPVMALAVIFPKLPNRLQTVLSFLWRRWIPILGGLQQVVFWKLALQNGLLAARPSVLLSLLLPVIGWGSVALLSPKFLVWNIFPAIFIYLLLVEIVNFPHHLQMLTGSGEDRWPIWRQHETARTCLYPQWFAKYVVLNFNYHAEHHMFPEVPWYSLPNVHEKVIALMPGQLHLDDSFRWIIDNRPREIIAIVANNKVGAPPLEKVS